MKISRDMNTSEVIRTGRAVAQCNQHNRRSLRIISDASISFDIFIFLYPTLISSTVKNV